MILKNRPLNFLKSVSSVFIAFLVMACTGHEEKTSQVSTSNETPHDLAASKLEKFVRKHDSRNGKANKVVLVIMEAGCIGCNKSFVSLVQNFVNEQGVFIVVSSTGVQLDISPFVGDTVTNAYHDVRNEFRGLGIVNGSAAIFTDGKHIDTIVNISADDIEGKLGFIKKRMMEISQCEE